MNANFELSEWELEQLKRLPPKHQQFAERYPVAISNVIDRLDSPPLPEGYQPKWIDFYYFDEAEEPHISFVRGELQYIVSTAKTGTGINAFFAKPVAKLSHTFHLSPSNPGRRKSP